MSGFITILLLILKILGIAIVSLLLFILLIVLLVLFSPIKYKVKLDYKENLFIDVRISWLLIIRGLYSKSEVQNYYLKILFFKIINSDKKKKKEKCDNKDISHTDNSASSSPESITDTIDKSDAANETKEAIKNNVTANEDISRSKVQPDDNSTDNNINTKSNNKNKLSKKYDKLLEIKNIISSETFKEAFLSCKSKLFKLIKNILPAKWSLFAHVGFDDPSTTGQVVAIYSILYGLFNNTLSKHVDFEADFENKVIEIHLNAKGKISIFKALKTTISLLFDKNIKKIIKQIKEI